MIYPIGHPPFPQSLASFPFLAIPALTNARAKIPEPPIRSAVSYHSLPCTSSNLSPQTCQHYSVPTPHLSLPAFFLHIPLILGRSSSKASDARNSFLNLISGDDDDGTFGVIDSVSPSAVAAGGVVGLRCGTPRKEDGLTPDMNCADGVEG